MLARRLLLLAAVLLLLAALAAGMAPQRGTDGGTAAQRPDLPEGTQVTETISAAGSDALVEVRRGDLLTLRVTGSEPDSVLIERLDRIESIEPSAPARFELLIDQAPGVYPLRLVEADRRIGSLQVTG